MRGQGKVWKDSRAAEEAGSPEEGIPEEGIPEEGTGPGEGSLWIRVVSLGRLFKLSLLSVPLHALMQKATMLTAGSPTL